MPLQNRVLPTGEIVADPARGLFVGNRGQLHTPARTLSGRRWTTHTWVTCLLCFRGRHRQVMGRGWTELFFLDEAVALAAEHRPCAECRRADYRRFQAAWRLAFDEDPTAPVMNARLHADRVDSATRGQRRYRSPVATLPDGCFVRNLTVSASAKKPEQPKNNRFPFESPCAILTQSQSLGTCIPPTTAAKQKTSS